MLLTLSLPTQARTFSFPATSPYPDWLAHTWVIHKNTLGVDQKTLRWNERPQLQLNMTSPSSGYLSWELLIPKNLRLSPQDTDLSAELAGPVEQTDQVKYRLRIPLGALERPQLVFFLVFSDGKVASVELKTRVRGERVWVLTTESCNSEALSLRESITAPFPNSPWAGLIAMDCSAPSKVQLTYFSPQLRPVGQSNGGNPLQFSVPVSAGSDGIVQSIALERASAAQPIQTFELHRGYLRTVNRKWFRHFELQGRAVLQHTTLGYSITPVPRWTPTLYATEDWAFSLAIGGSAYNVAQRGGFAGFGESELWVRYRALRPITFALGGGVESWFSRGGTSPKAGVQVSWEFERPPLRIFERLTVGYALQFMPGDFVHQLTGGIGIGF